MVIRTATEIGMLRERQRQLGDRILHLEGQIKRYSDYLRDPDRAPHDREELLPNHRIQARLPLAKASMPERVIHYLNDNPKRAFATSEVAKGVGVAGKDLTTLRTTLYRLAKDARISRHGRGMYRAAEPPPTDSTADNDSGGAT
jgi:hypothetical protein